jgi:RNA polymerase sigma-70 factor (ECF subfamily)
MGAIPIFQSIVSAPKLEGMPQSRLGRRSKAAGPFLGKVTDVIKGAQWTPASEEWSMIQRALDEDTEALSVLLTRDKEKLYHVAYSVLGNKEDAEDGLQDGLLSAYLNLRSFEGRSRFSTWITSIVIHAARKKCGKLRSLPQTSLDDIVDEGARRAAEWVVDGRPNPKGICSLVEARELVDAGMSRLPTLLRAAIRIHPIGSSSFVEAPLEASVKRNTLKSRSSRARKQLAILLAARGVNSWIEHFRGLVFTELGRIGCI